MTFLLGKFTTATILSNTPLKLPAKNSTPLANGLAVSAILATGLVTSSVSHANYFTNHADYPAFRQKLVATGKVAGYEVDNALEQAQFKQSIIDVMQRPGESKPWYLYEEAMLTDAKITAGKRFARSYASALNRAEQQYGVPKSIILGILGVETQYGANKGNFRTLDALATLGFGYPSRAPYFQSELGEFILLNKERETSPTTAKSSYAGAMGYPQFMPSSIRKWAVDFDGDGRIDLNGSAVDAIGSIANYFKQHGWQTGMPVAYPTTFMGSNDKAVVTDDLTKPLPITYFVQNGLRPTLPVANSAQVAGIKLEGINQPEYWLGTPNFQVITTYNKSRKYAMAVWKLGEAIVE